MATAVVVVVVVVVVMVMVMVHGKQKGRQMMLFINPENVALQPLFPISSQLWSPQGVTRFKRKKRKEIMLINLSGCTGSRI
ncbi:hypothetical protein F4820DRAFT_417301 [Hypoxylon rubiginosum]|uniref:Uncharacterized protein n=1 Tax=Hypoxylon rubiginosum TaxID=110542 RepID=A0ACB9Z3G4_9PEZI|nr:hypothetical protein F4820DRAFT_417301 [Hypoxylon rubiginosum]